MLQNKSEIEKQEGTKPETQPGVLFHLAVFCANHMLLTTMIYSATLLYFYELLK